jgi:tRNA threonylcarbamoyladenosine biosynthesis protein TsaB
VTAAKVFAYAVGAEVLGINTLEAIAANSQGGTAGLSSSASNTVGQANRATQLPTAGQASSATPHSSISVVIDAQRGEVVVQSFARQADGWFAPAGAEELLDADAWLAQLSPRPKGEGTVITGPGLVRLLDRLPPGVEALDQALWQPRAAAVGRLAARYHAQGRRDDLWKLVPHYYRRSAAEEKWDARMAQK